MAFLSYKSTRLAYVAPAIALIVLNLGGLTVWMGVVAELERRQLHAERLERIDRQAEEAEAEVLAAIDVELAEAEAYNKLRQAQAHCGATLEGFYFAAGLPLAAQLDNWGIDWHRPKYNTEQWVPLFDSTGLLFGAIRQGSLAQADITPMDQASICNHNVLSMEKNDEK